VYITYWIKVRKFCLFNRERNLSNSQWRKTRSFWPLIRYIVGKFQHGCRKIKNSICILHNLFQPCWNLPTIYRIKGQKERVFRHWLFDKFRSLLNKQNFLTLIQYVMYTDLVNEFMYTTGVIPFEARYVHPDFLFCWKYLLFFYLCLL
jgi:hypothetical protein